MSETPPPAPNSTPDPVPTTTGSIADPADVEKNKVMAILAYLWLLVLIPIFAAKDSRFARYHANQGLLLLIAFFVLYVVLGILGAIIAFIPVVQACACAVIPLMGLLSLANLVLVILGIVNAANGKMQPLPVIGTLFTILK
jgi:uncharacterized membrane protein